jgi:hypothetical protein
VRAVLVAALLASCGGGDKEPSTGCGSSGPCPLGLTCSPTTQMCVMTGAPPDAAPADAPLPDATPACLPGSGPTLHPGSVSTNETWTAAASPHVVRNDINVSATLTIEPCVEVRLGPKVTIGVGTTGRIVAEGNTFQGIHVTADQAGQPFASIHTVGGGTLRLAYVTVDGGGDPLTSVPASAGMLNLQGADGSRPPQETLSVDHVQITGSASNGLVLRDGAGFAAGSTGLTVDGSALWPVTIWARAAGTLPGGRYTGNARDEITFSGGTGNAAVLEDMTLHELGVPYRVGDGLAAPDLRVDAPNGSTKLVTLTIEPGVTLHFPKGGVMHVQTFTGTTPALAALIALGTPDRPIVFTSGEAAPAAGDWLGVWFGLVPDPSDRIDHARFEFGGGTSTSGSSACPTLFGTITNDAPVRIFGPPASAFITNSVFMNSAGHGIDRGWRADNVTDFLPTNLFANIAWCKESVPATANNICPAPADACVQ